MAVLWACSQLVTAMPGSSRSTPSSLATDFDSDSNPGHSSPTSILPSGNEIGSTGGSSEGLRSPRKEGRKTSRMQQLAKSLELLGLTTLEGLTRKELRKIFKKRSLTLLPERHPGTMNAHSIFEEFNAAFLEVS